MLLHPEDNCQCVEMFLALTRGGEEWKGCVTGIWWVQDRDAINLQSTGQPPYKNDLARSVSSAEVEKSYVDKVLRV